MLVQVYDGKTRGIGIQDNGGWVKIGFEFRDYMHHFKGAKFSVLMCLILHSSENGISYPSFTLMEEETGYGRQAISRAIDGLCKTVIEGQQILLKYESKNLPRNFKRNSQYIIFPSPDEIKIHKIADRYENHTSDRYENHTVIGMKIIPEVEPIVEPIKEEPHTIIYNSRNSKKRKFESHPEDIPNLIRSYSPGKDGIPGHIFKDDYPE